jgi:hypothetical protein
VVVAAMSDALAQLRREIAGVVQRLPSPPP